MSASLLRTLPRAALQAQRNVAARPFHVSARRLDVYKDASPEIFNKVVKESKDRLVLVDFYADWCGPCRTLSPILEKLASDASVKSGSGHAVDLVKIDTDQEANIPLSMEYQVKALPTVVAFRNGEPVNQFVGALRENDIQKFLQSL